jgi:DNA-binding CsgD family transcriptional regulator
MTGTTAQRDALLDLIGTIYDASVQPSKWPQVVAETASLMGSTRALMLTPFHRLDAGGIYFPHGIPETFMQQYASRYIEHDIWAQRGMERGAYVEGNVFRDRDLLTLQEMLESIFYREFLSKMDILRLCSGVVFSQHSAVPMPTNLAFFRGVREPEFDEGNRDFLRLALPHFSRALGIHVRLHDAELRSALSLSALDRLASGVILVGAQGKILHLNRVANQIIASNDGLSVNKQLDQMVLAAVKPRGKRALHAAIELALHPDTIEVPHFSHGVRITRPSGRPPYVLNLAPLPPENEFGGARGRAHVIIFIVDPGAAQVLDAALLKKLYGFTEAEARVAARLYVADTTRQAAEALGIAEATVRAHLKSIFVKTGTHRQSELMKLLSSIASIQ